MHNSGIAKKDISLSIDAIRVFTRPSAKPGDRFQKSKMIPFFKNRDDWIENSLLQKSTPR
jgi:hypothetical protein